MSLPTMHLEAVLFSSAKPISIDMLAEVFGLSTEETQKYIEELQCDRASVEPLTAIFFETSIKMKIMETSVTKKIMTKTVTDPFLFLISIPLLIASFLLPESDLLR